MPEYGLILLLIATGVGIALLTHRRLHATRFRNLSRRAYFDHCRPLLTNTRIGKTPTGFPRLSGEYEGREYDLQVIPDTLTFRKLPALWMMVTLPRPMPVQSTFDLMIRPTGVEPFSRFHNLPDQIAIPEGFPEDCAIRTDDPKEIPPEHVIRAHLTLFDDPRIKEVVISPKGLRIVFLAEEANRSRYLLFRDSEMGRTPISPDRIVPLLDKLLAMENDIKRQHRLNSRRAA